MSRKVILVVDDESTNVTIVANILSKSYDIKVATNGYTALEILQKEKIDLILLDVVMPKMSGYEVSSAILANEKTKMIPFIFLTALTSPEHIKEGFKYGAVDYISKPFSKEELEARISTHIGIASLQKSLSRTVEDLNHQMIEVEKNKKEFEAIFNYSNDGIAILDMDSNFLNFNKAYLDMTGYTKEELSSKSCLELTADEDKERSMKFSEAVLKTGDVKNFEKTCIVKNGVRLKTNLSMSLLPDKKRFLLVTKDVSDLKALEEQARIASLSELIHNIAHQWRQPLSLISTIASGMKVSYEYGVLDERDMVENMDKIVEQTEYLSSTIENFSHLINFETELEEISLVNILNEMLGLVESSLSYNDITLISDLKDDLIIQCKKGEVIQALINVINNAIDAMEKNISETAERYLLVSTMKIDANKVELKIIDSGGGMKKSVKNRIFEPYFTTKHQSIGTGMGLSTTYKILHEKHNYPIDVYNKEFQYENKKYTGVCFSVVFSTLKL